MTDQIEMDDEVMDLNARGWGIGKVLHPVTDGRVQVDFGAEGIKLLDLNHARLAKVGVAVGPALEINLKNKGRRA